MKLTLTNREQAYSVGHWLVDSFDQSNVNVRSSWLVEHTEDDTHGNITCYSLVVNSGVIDPNTNQPTSGNITGGGNLTIAGPNITLGPWARIFQGVGVGGSVRFRLLDPNDPNGNLAANGTTSPGRAYAQQVGLAFHAFLQAGNTSFAFFDELRSITYPIFEIGYNTSEVLNQLIVTGNQPIAYFSLGSYLQSYTDQGIIYASTKQGYYERARSTQMGDWVSFSPSITHFVLGNGTVTGFYALVGHTVFFEINITFGSTTTYGAAGTSPVFTLPFANDAATAGMVLGQWGAVSNFSNAGAVFSGPFTNSGASAGIPVGMSIATSAKVLSAHTNAYPFTWGTADQLTISGCYRGNFTP
jgi:hypothetical protein